MMMSTLAALHYTERAVVGVMNSWECAARPDGVVVCAWSIGEYW